MVFYRAFVERYWDYYKSIQHYRDGPTDELAETLRKEFDELFSTRTGYAALDDRIAKTAAKKGELLTVLSRPEVPLHNNASELGARVSARRRDVSLHSKSAQGAQAMDIFTTIVQTSKKLGVSAYAYLRDRISRRFELPSLAQSIQAAAANG
ncbi:MAG: transposase [Planctomycetes bacterium]|nr:transposase [Planctomycetota bacterium]